MKATLSTKSIKAKAIQREWHLIDLKGKVLGRMTPQIAQFLQGKHKRNYVSYLDMGDNVVIVNAGHVQITGKKEQQKKYTRYSGYPGGLRVESYSELKKRNPAKVITLAVSGMLPKNKYRDDRLKRLYIFVDENHGFGDKFINKS